MLEHKIKQLKDCEAVSDIIVSPDSDKMLKMAEAQGVEAWKRTEKYNLDEVPFGEPVEYICKQLLGGILAYYDMRWSSNPIRRHIPPLFGETLAYTNGINLAPRKKMIELHYRFGKCH